MKTLTIVLAGSVLVSCSSSSGGGQGAPETRTGCPTTCSGTDSNGRCRVVLVTGGGNAAGDLNVTATTAYWASVSPSGMSAELMSVPICGGAVASIASVSGILSGVAVDASGIYWTAGYDVMRAPLTGGSAQTIVSETGKGNPGSLVVRGGNVIWTDTTCAVESAPVTGGSVTTLASSQNMPGSLVATDAHLFWANNFNPTPCLGGAMAGDVLELPLQGGTPTVVGQGQPAVIGVDDTNVYWVNGGGIGSSDVMMAPLAGGGIVTLASEPGYVLSLVTDGTSVYWNVVPTGPPAPGTVVKWTVDGGTLSTIANESSAPESLAVDATSLYWTNRHGDVVKLTPK
jgi:hypothetical protein